MTSVPLVGRASFFIFMSCPAGLCCLVVVDYINPSRREVAGWLLSSEFRADLVQGFDLVHLVE